MWKTHYSLCITSWIFVLPIAYVLYKFLQNDTIPAFEYILVGLICINIGFSVAFWYNPLQDSAIHIYDAFFAKLSMMTVMFYFLSQVNHLVDVVVFLTILAGIVASAYFSNHFSEMEWCCNKHIQSHGFMHLFCGLGCVYAMV
jgi:vacuolar-type H+-ATPase subunit I/STV1